MRITGVEGIILRLPLRQAVADGTQDDLLIRIETDEGITGYGEVDTSPEVGKAVIDAEMSHGTCYGLREILIGMDPFDIEQIWNLMYRKTNYYGRLGVVLHAMSGVDMALWDILGKAVGKPVHKLLGGSFCDKVRPYASMLMPETAEEVREFVGRYAEQGFTAMKFGYGPLGKDVRRDVQLAAAAKEAAGPNVEVMIDIGHGYTLKMAMQAAKEFESLGIYWMEEPFPPEAIHDYQRLCDSTSLRIAAGEQDVGRWTSRRLIWEAHLDVIQPDISRVGGLTEAKRIAYMAHEANRVCVPHAFRTGLLVAACLHLIAAIPNSAFLEFSVTDSALRRELLLEPFKVVRGYVAVPAKPGLGIELNAETIERYRVH
ncbi:MAG TPA: mandelate racemase/muconate lactonizing enzyme family protein [Terriglobia bacterium]|nr:mandelate racemase/muconate lactonizing enzyme family protein [Terriglobia bacterium]